MAKYELGDQTYLIYDKIFDCTETLLTEQQMRELSETHRFENGTIERLYHLGYHGSADDIDNIVNFIMNKCKEHKVDLSRQTVRNWFDDINPDVTEEKKHGPPNDSEQSRQNVYKICFALEMNSKETEVFFLKNYMCMPYNFKNTYEAVYYFCLNTGRNYQTARKILENASRLEAEEALCTADTRDTRFGETRALGIHISELHTEEDLITYIQSHRYDKKSQFYTATRLIFGKHNEDKNYATSEDGNTEDEGLLAKCKKIAAEETMLRYFSEDIKPIRGIEPNQ